MPPTQFVDPRQLRLPGGRHYGADPTKLQRQFARFGASIDTMPPQLVTLGRNDEMLLIDDVTRATWAAKLVPGCVVPVEVLDQYPDWDLGRYPTVGERLP